MDIIWHFGLVGTGPELLSAYLHMPWCGVQITPHCLLVQGCLDGEPGKGRINQNFLLGRIIASSFSPGSEDMYEFSDMFINYLTFWIPVDGLSTLRDYYY